MKVDSSHRIELPAKFYKGSSLAAAMQEDSDQNVTLVTAADLFQNPDIAGVAILTHHQMELIMKGSLFQVIQAAIANRQVLTTIQRTKRNEHRLHLPKYWDRYLCLGNAPNVGDEVAIARMLVPNIGDIFRFVRAKALEVTPTPSLLQKPPLRKGLKDDRTLPLFGGAIPA